MNYFEIQLDFSTFDLLENEINMSYFICNGPKEGPFELGELMHQHLKPDTLVLDTQTGQWQKANEIEEIAFLLNQKKEQEHPSKTEMPKTWLVESILATLFCCLPFGLVGLIKAANVGTLYQAGKYAEAVVASQEAGKWTKISIAVGIILGLLYLAFWIIGIGLSTLK